VLARLLQLAIGAPAPPVRGGGVWVEWAQADQPPVVIDAYPFSSSPQTTPAGKSIPPACGLIASVTLNFS
jgi:hypothetical protein